MATDKESFNRDLYDLLKVRGYDPVPLDSRNQRVPASQTADVIQFTFIKDGVDYGKAWITIDDTQNVVVYYDDEQQQSPSSPTPGVEYDDSWTGFLTNLKQWAQRRQLSFELSNKDHLGDDMRQREYYKMKERLGESIQPRYTVKPTKYSTRGKFMVRDLKDHSAAGVYQTEQEALAAAEKLNKERERRLMWGRNDDNAPVSESYHPMGKKASYNDAVPNVKIVLQHNRSLEEGEARFRNVAKIYLENADGERFLAPTNKPGIARVYARHIAEGGLPNDERWNHIKSVCEDYNKMAGFVRATKNKQFNESTQPLVQEGIEYYNNIRESLHKLSTHKGYQSYFESWTPSLMEGDDEDLSEMFMSSSMDPRIENAMPILSRIHKKVDEMKEIDSLAEWADAIINEKLEISEMDKEHGSKRDFDNARGPDKTAKPVSAKKFAKDASKSLNKAVKNVKEDGAPRKFQEYEVFNVQIPANVYTGKYHDYQTARYTVFKGMDGVETEQDAIDWINNHKEQVLADLDSRRIPYGDRKVKLVRTPAAKNVFFKDKYYVKPGKISRATDAPAKANFDPSALGQVDEVLDTRAAKMSYAQKNMDSHGAAMSDYMNAGSDEGKKAGAHKTAMKRVRGLNTFVKNKVTKDEVDENFIGMAPQAVAEEQGSGLEAFLQQYPEAEDAMRNAVRHFEYAYDAMDHVAGSVLHKMPYSEWEKVRPAIIAYFEKYGLKADANDGVNEDLGPEQKKVGQLGPTEKVKNNNIGKLVGASESKEIDPELARIIEMARFKR